jgi:signal transduction histidine kinase
MSNNAVSARGSIKRLVHARAGSPRAPLMDRVLAGFTRRARAHWPGYVFGLAAVALVTIVLWPLLSRARVEGAAGLYVIAVLATAALYGRGPALMASVVSILTYDFLYVEPVFQFGLSEPQEWLALLVLFLTGLVAGQLAAALRQQAEGARQREREAVALREVARLVPGSSLELQPLLSVILERLETIVDYDAAEVILRDAPNEAVIFAYRGPLPRERLLGRRVRPGDALWKLLDEADRRRDAILVEDLGGRSLLAQDLAATGMSVPSESAHSELAVPLIVKGRVIGVQTLIHSQPGYYGARHAELALVFAQQAAVAIDNARLYGELRAHLDEVVGLQEFGATLLQDHDVNRVLEAVCLQLQRLTNAEGAAVALLDREARVLELRSVVGPHAAELQGGIIPIEGSFSGDAMRTNAPVRVDDVQQDPRGSSWRQAPLDINSLVTVPLQTRQGALGTITMYNKQDLPGFTERDADLAMLFAQHAAVAIENAGLYTEVRARLDEVVGLQRLGATLLQEHDFDRVLHSVCEQLQLLTGAERAVLALLEEDGRSFVLRSAVGPGVSALVGANVPVDGSFAAEAIRTNSPVRSDDLQNDPRGLRPSLLPDDAHSLLTVPMRTRQRVLGVITLVNKLDAPGFTNRDTAVATLFAQQAAVAIENAMLYEEGRGIAALEERQRLARELHDSVSQALYGVALNASAADELFESAPDRARGLLRDVLRLADAGLAELRALIFELRPESLEREGLVGALEKQAAAVQARHGVHVRLEVQREPDLSQPVKEALYRVAQEALHNAARHARAQTLNVALELADHEVRLVVADDGRGFDPHGEFPGHLGLQSMRERTAGAGGTLDIESAPGAGTRLSARIPIG